MEISIETLRLRKDFGMRGYGIFRYIENLLWYNEEKLYQYFDIPALAYEMQESVDDVTKIIMEYDLFIHDNNNGTFSMNQHIE